ncbi:hypothetical protein AALO_G00207430 [Alosa alosa]|uniref:Uncharacterized protein n=1 Tax=Alosa alosa TaxID=278164 RepID=A0AAV6FYX2_9TELE|nr:hypothetical protein AALO_G00207430 [Alosa alosa]
MVTFTAAPSVPRRKTNLATLRLPSRKENRAGNPAKFPFNSCYRTRATAGAVNLLNVFACCAVVTLFARKPSEAHFSN